MISVKKSGVQQVNINMKKFYIFTIIFILFASVFPCTSIAEKTMLSPDLRIDTITAIVILAPILHPIGMALHMDPIHFGMIVVLITRIAQHREAERAQAMPTRGGADLPIVAPVLAVAAGLLALAATPGFAQHTHRPAQSQARTPRGLYEPSVRGIARTTQDSCAIGTCAAPGPPAFTFSSRSTHVCLPVFHPRACRAPVA